MPQTLSQPPPTRAHLDVDRELVVEEHGARFRAGGRESSSRACVCEDARGRGLFVCVCGARTAGECAVRKEPRVAVERSCASRAAQLAPQRAGGRGIARESRHLPRCVFGWWAASEREAAARLVGVSARVESCLGMRGLAAGGESASRRRACVSRRQLASVRRGQNPRAHVDRLLSIKLEAVKPRNALGFG